MNAARVPMVKWYNGDVIIYNFHSRLKVVGGQLGNCVTNQSSRSPCDHSGMFPEHTQHR